jgi:hypothetical protein
MTTYFVQVTLADGDDFAAPHVTSTISVLEASALKAKLLAEQLALTPHPGKPAHPQIVRTLITNTKEGLR